MNTKIKGERENITKNRKIDSKPTKQVVIDTGLHQLLKIKAASTGVTIKTLIEGCLADLLAVENRN